MREESTSVATVGDKFYDLLRRHGVEPFEYMGRPAFMPRQLASALGYSHHRHMLRFLTTFRGSIQGVHYGILTGDELAAAKGVSADGLVGGRTSRREVILFLPGLNLVLLESDKARSGVLGREYRWWVVDYYMPAVQEVVGMSAADMLVAIATNTLPKRPTVELAAPIPEPPKQIEGPPAAVMLALAKGGTRIGDVFATSYLAAELARSKAKDRADREARKSAEHADRVALRREREAQRLARRAKKVPPTTLW